MTPDEEKDIREGRPDWMRGDLRRTIASIFSTLDATRADLARLREAAEAVHRGPGRERAAIERAENRAVEEYERLHTPHASERDDESWRLGRAHARICAANTERKASADRNLRAMHALDAALADPSPDAWLAARDARVRREALEEAATIALGVPLEESGVEWLPVARWLRSLAETPPTSVAARDRAVAVRTLRWAAASLAGSHTATWLRACADAVESGREEPP